MSTAKPRSKWNAAKEARRAKRWDDAQVRARAVAHQEKLAAQARHAEIARRQEAAAAAFADARAIVSRVAASTFDTRV